MFNDPQKIVAPIKLEAVINDAHKSRWYDIIKPSEKADRHDLFGLDSVSHLMILSNLLRMIHNCDPVDRLDPQTSLT